MTRPFAWPAAARFGRRVPRDKLFERAGGGKAIRALYADQIERIVWSHKLFSGSVNLPAGASVAEIEVLEVVLRGEGVDDRVLDHLDRGVPQRTVLELRRGEGAAGEVMMAAAFKRPSEGGSASGARAERPVVLEHARGDWHKVEAERAPLPPAVDLDVLYAGLLRALWPHPARPGEGLRAHAERLSAAAAQAKVVTRLETCARREARFARQVELMRELRGARIKLGELTDA